MSTLALQPTEVPVISARERELLLRKAQAGDHEALNVLFASCRKTLYCRALRILGRPQDAEDAVQEAMFAAFVHLHRFQGRADFLTWATRIVTNAALQHIRKMRKKPVVSWDQTGTEFHAEQFSEHLRDPQPTPEERLQGLEQREILEDALHKLPVENRRAIQLCKFADYSLREAARTLGLPVGTLKVRLHRGRRALMVSVKRKVQGRRKSTVGKRSSQGNSTTDESLCAA